MRSRIVVLAPHVDDGELGCGGTIARLLEEKCEVFYVAFSTAEESLPPGFPSDTLCEEVKDAMSILGIPSQNLILFHYQVRQLNYHRQDILEELVRIRNEIQPELVFMPSLNDLHQDHHVISMEGLRAFKQKSVLGYELPWNNIDFRTQAFYILSPEHIERKCAALLAYKSQSERRYLTREFIESLARTRGVQIGTDYAEAFEVIRFTI